MKVGVIGAGYWGSKHILEYRKLGHQVLVFDPVSENLKQFQKISGIIFAKSYSDILRDEELLYLSICTPNQTHFKIGKEAILRGKNVLIEKPLTLNSDKAYELYKLAKRKDVKLMVGHIFRFNNAIGKTKHILSEGLLGKIYHVRFDWHQMTTRMRDKNIILDIGLHPLDIIYYLFDTKPKKIDSVGQSFRNEFLETTLLNFNINTPNYGKIFCTIDLSWITPLRRRIMTIIGSEKTLEIKCVDQKIRLIDNVTEKSRDIHIVPNNSMQDELNYFLSCSKKELMKKNNKPNGLVGVNVIEMVERATKS